MANTRGKKQSAGLATVAFILKILILLLIVVIIAWIGTISYRFSYKVFADEPYSETGGLTKSATVFIESGASAMDVASMLENDGLIEDKWVFYAQITFSQAKDEIQSGSYNLSSEMSAEEMIEVITEITEEEEEEEEEESDTSDTGSVTAGSADLLDSSLSSEEETSEEEGTEEEEAE